MLATFVGAISLIFVLAGFVGVYAYTQFPAEKRAMAPLHWGVYLASYLVVIAVGLVGLTAAISGSGTLPAILGLLAIGGAIPAMAEFLLGRRVDIESSPPTDRLRERWGGRLCEHIGDTWR